jgi:hypothetical protein
MKSVNGGREKKHIRCAISRRASAQIPGATGISNEGRLLDIQHLYHPISTSMAERLERTPSWAPLPS